MSTKSTEASIRGYLETLRQGNKPVIDRAAISELKAQIRAETDVINKAKLLSELERESAGRVPDNTESEAAFIAAGKAWADENEVTVGALQAMGVSTQVLRQAGFDPKPGAGSVRAGGGGGAGTRAPRIPLDEVAAKARKLGSGWKLSDLAAVLDREITTTRNYVNQLIDNKVIADLGDDPKHDGRGRAAKIYGVK